MDGLEVIINRLSGHHILYRLLAWAVVCKGAQVLRNMRVRQGPGEVMMCLICKG